MSNCFGFIQSRDIGLASSRLYDQGMFYKAFANDLRAAREQVIIESPFITVSRLNTLMPILNQLKARGVRVIINTKPLHEHNDQLYVQAVQAVGILQDADIKVLMTIGHHRKTAIIDDILWEGSLNILSQNDSCEFMRRIKSAELATQMLRFTGLHKWVRMI